MKVKLNIPYRINERGQILCKISDLTDSEYNKKIYGDEEAEDNKINEIADEMKEMMSEGEEVPNYVPIPIDEDGNKAGGHTRTQAAIMAGYNEVSVTVLSHKKFNKQMSSYDKVFAVIKQNSKSRKKKPSVSLNEYNQLDENYRQTFKQTPPNETTDEWIKEIDSNSPIPITKTTIEKLKIVKMRDPSLFKEVDQGKLTVNQAYLKAKKSKPKKPVNPNRLNFFKILDNDPLIQKYAVYNFIKSVKHILSSTMKTRNGTEIEDTFDETIGSEKHLTSTAISNKMMSALALAFKDAKFVVQTPINKMGDPDIRFPEDSLPQFESEKIEIKASENRTKGIRIYAGERATSIAPHEFCLVVWANNFKKLAIFFTTMTGDDWNKSDEKSKDCFTTIEQVYKNHTPGVDFIPFVGDVQVINEDVQIKYADTDQVFEELKKENLLNPVTLQTVPSYQSVDVAGCNYAPLSL